MVVDFGQIDTARQQAESAQRTATEYGAQGITLADELRKAIGERFAQSDVAKGAATARADFLSQAPQARAESLGLVQGGAILSPTQQRAIEASKRSAALVPLIAANINQEAMFGNIEDLVGAGSRAFQAQAAQKQGLAELAQSSYSNLLNELLQRAQEERAAELFPIQKATAQAQLNKLQAPSASEVAKTQANEARKWLATQTGNRNEALQDARSLIAKGYDPTVVYGIIDKLYPVPKNKSLQFKAGEYGQPNLIFDPRTGTIQEVSDRIRVRNKKTGQTGTIPENEFDAKIYEKIY